jgi:transposase
MSENLTITHERVDDLPLLLAQLERRQVAALLDAHFPTHDGNWHGQSLGTVASVGLTFILSEANHRLSPVEPWAAQRLTTLAAGVGPPVRALDFSDDRLAAVLDYLSADLPWEAFEQALNAQTLRVYDLQPQRVRIDSTTAKSYGTVTPEGLLQLGHSQDHRPDLPQVTIHLSVLDPLGLPLTTTVGSGARADDPLSLPEIQRVQASVRRRGLTYVGDCQMAALQTRATVAASGDYYRCPLSSTQLPAAELAAVLAPVWRGAQPLRAIYQPAAQTRPQRQRIAEG